MNKSIKETILWLIVLLITCLIYLALPSIITWLTSLLMVGAIFTIVIIDNEIALINKELNKPRYWCCVCCSSMPTNNGHCIKCQSYIKVD